MPPSMPPAFRVDSLQLNLQGSPIVVINKLILYTCPPCKHGDKMNVGAMWLAFGLAPKSGDRHTHRTWTHSSYACASQVQGGTAGREATPVALCQLTLLSPKCQGAWNSRGNAVCWLRSQGRFLQATEGVQIFIPR